MGGDEFLDMLLRPLRCQILATRIGQGQIGLNLTSDSTWIWLGEGLWQKKVEIVDLKRSVVFRRICQTVVLSW